MSIESMAAWMAVWRLSALRALARDEEAADRGDVPGWVMITVMTAALVVAILVPFRAAILKAVTKALSQVTGT